MQSVKGFLNKSELLAFAVAPLWAISMVKAIPGWPAGISFILFLIYLYAWSWVICLPAYLLLRRFRIRNLVVFTFIGVFLGWLADYVLWQTGSAWHIAAVTAKHGLPDRFPFVRLGIMSGFAAISVWYISTAGKDGRA